MIALLTMIKTGLLLIACSQHEAFTSSGRILGSQKLQLIKSSPTIKMASIFDGFLSSVSPAPFSSKKLCVITGTSSGLGKETAKSLLKTGDYYVICACRDVDKMKEVAESEGFDSSSHSILKLDLASFDSVKSFVKDLKSFKKSRPLDVLVCNAAVYQPALPTVSCNRFKLLLVFFHNFFVA